MKRSVLLSCLVVFAFLGSGQAARRQQSANSTPSLHAAQRNFLDQYCVTCHNQRAKTAGLLLDQPDLTRVGENAEVWEKVVRKLRAGMMPPSGARRPDVSAANSFTTWLETELDRAAAGKPNYGLIGLHRLNRAEY